MNIGNLLLRDVRLILGNVIYPVRYRDPDGVQPVVGHSLEVVFRDPRVPVFFENL